MTTPSQLSVYSPYDDSLVGTVAISTRQEMLEALSRADALFRHRKTWLPTDERMRILSRTADLLEAQRASVIRTAVLEGGKPYKDTVVEFDRALDGLRNCSELARSESGHAVPMGATAASRQRIAFTQREPIGPVLAISAFNHPLNLIVHQIGPAIAAGCPVLVKPARDTPLSCQTLVQALYDAGLPKDWCTMVVPASHDDIEVIVRDSRIRFLSFIGSAELGWKLRTQIAPGTRCALEHGGMAPVIVAGDADIELAAQGVAKGGFYHAGQVCVSVQRVYVHESVEQAFTTRLVEIADALVTGDPLEPTTDVGPLIRKAETARVSRWINEAIAQGASLIAGNTGAGNCLAPTILLNPPPGSNIASREIFGPVVSLHPYADLDEAIDQANSVPFAFQAAVFTRSLETALKVYSHINASAVMVNDHSAFRVDWMPFAGLNQSGLGVGGIPATYHEMTTEKMMVLRGIV